MRAWIDSGEMFGPPFRSEEGCFVKCGEKGFAGDAVEWLWYR